MGKRKVFSSEFKAEAAGLVLDKGYSIQDACEAMGVSISSMDRWVRQVKGERHGITPKGKAITAEQQEIQALKARIKQLEMEKSILKKASALLMSDSYKSAS